MYYGLIFCGMFLVGYLLWDIHYGIFTMGYPTMGESTYVLWDNLPWENSPTYCGIIY